MNLHASSNTDFTHLGIRTPLQLKRRRAELGGAEYIIPNLVPRRSLILGVGDSGLGKSPLMYEVAICVAAGIPFLGFPVVKGRVLYVDCENGLGQVVDMVGQLSKYLGVAQPPEDLLLWNLNDAPEKFGQAGCRIEDLIRGANPTLVIIDPLKDIYTNIETDNSKTTEEYQRIRRVMQEVGCSVLGIHHIRKPDMKGARLEPLETADLRQWFYQTRGPRVLITGSDVRIGFDQASRSDLIVRGYERVRGEFPRMLLDRVMDEHGEPLGYRRLVGVDLLANKDQQNAYANLPTEFTFRQARAAYGRQDQATSDFLRNCLDAGILAKFSKGVYRKVGQTEQRGSDVSPSPQPAELPEYQGNLTVN